MALFYILLCAYLSVLTKGSECWSNATQVISHILFPSNFKLLEAISLKSLDFIFTFVFNPVSHQSHFMLQLQPSEVRKQILRIQANSEINF